MPILPTTPQDTFLGVQLSSPPGNAMIITPSNSLLLTPSRELTEPWQDPPLTSRAVSVDEMFLMTVSGDIAYDYEVGLAPNFAPIVVTLENRTVSNELGISFDLPTFIATDAPTDLVVEREQKKTFQFLFVEADAKAKSLQTTRVFAEWVSIIITPLLVTGPVYIKPSSSV